MRNFLITMLVVLAAACAAACAAADQPSTPQMIAHLGDGGGGGDTLRRTDPGICTAEDQEAGLCGGGDPFLGLKNKVYQYANTTYPNHENNGSITCGVDTYTGVRYCDLILQVGATTIAVDCMDEFVNGHPTGVIVCYSTSDNDLMTIASVSARTTDPSICTAEDQAAGLCGGGDPFLGMKNKTKQYADTTYPNHENNGSLNCGVDSYSGAKYCFLILNVGATTIVVNCVDEIVNEQITGVINCWSGTIDDDLTGTESM